MRGKRSLGMQGTENEEEEGIWVGERVTAVREVGGIKKTLREREASA